MFLTLLRDAALGWWQDEVPDLAAAIAFYTLFSFAPLVIVAIMIAGVVYGEEAAAGQLVARLEGIVGHTAGQVIQAAIANASRPRSGVLPTLVSVVVSLFGATAVFSQLGDALDRVWERDLASSCVDDSATTHKRRSILLRAKRAVLEQLRSQIGAFTLVVVIGLSLLASLFASTALAGLGRHAAALGQERLWLGRAVDLLVSVGVSTLAFTLIYKILPRCKAAWRDLWLGAFIAAVLFSVGRWLIGVYLAHSSVASVYGAAGALVVLLIWTWCSAMVLLFGAEFCHVYAGRQGRKIGRTQANPDVEPGTSQAPEIFAGYGS